MSFETPGPIPPVPTSDVPTAAPTAENIPPTPSAPDATAWKEELGVAPLTAPTEVPAIGGPEATGVSALQVAAERAAQSFDAQIKTNPMPEGAESPIGPMPTQPSAGEMIAPPPAPEAAPAEGSTGFSDTDAVDAAQKIVGDAPTPPTAA